MVGAVGALEAQEAAEQAFLPGGSGRQFDGQLRLRFWLVQQAQFPLEFFGHGGGRPHGLPDDVDLDRAGPFAPQGLFHIFDDLGATPSP